MNPDPCVTCAVFAGLPVGRADVVSANPWVRIFVSRTLTFCTTEIWRIRRDRSELVTRAIQPVLWLVVFGETIARLRGVPSDGRPYLDYLAPGIMAQATLFISIFYGIQIIWERDAGLLAKLLATPTPAAALVTGKAFAASIRSLSQVAVVLAISAVMGIRLDWNPVHLVAAVVVSILGAAFFTTLSVCLAGILLKRERMMGIAQAITMPLFFGSSALYPIDLMPPWLRAISAVNPLSHMVDALRGVLLDTGSALLPDLTFLVVAVVIGIASATALLPRLVR